MHAASVPCHSKDFGADRKNYQILIEADYIVNACESGYSKQNISDFMDKIMKTASGKTIAKEVFHV